MKVFLYILILIGLTFIGYCFSKKYKEKLAFYKDLNDFCNVLENQIKFNKNSLEEIVKFSLSNYKSKLNGLIQNFFINKLEYQNIDLLSEKENAFIKNFFNSLGKLDTVGEVSNIANHKIEIHRKIDDAQEQNKKYGTMGTKLGFIAGLLVCIVLI